MSDRKKSPIVLIPGPEALTAEGLIRMFEAIKDRPATPEEVAEFEAKAYRLNPPAPGPQMMTIKELAKVIEANACRQPTETAPAPVRRSLPVTRWGRDQAGGIGLVGGVQGPPADQEAPTTRGRPASWPHGTGFGVSGITTKGPPADSAEPVEPTTKH